MHSDERLLTETIEQAMAIYSETRPRTADERAAALRELRCYLPLLIKHNIADPICLTGKALRHRRKLHTGRVPGLNLASSQTCCK